MPTIQRRMLSFKDKAMHESRPNEFLSYPSPLLQKRMKELLDRYNYEIII